MAGIKDGISGGLSPQDNSDTGLSESNFISIDEISNSGLNYQDVATEGFYVTPVWKWMVSDIEKLKELVPVLYKIKDAGNFLFKLRNPELTVKDMSESVMREVVGQRDLQFLLTEGRQEVEQVVRVLLQEILDSYKSGIFVQSVQLQSVDPPDQVIDAFDEVQRARQDKTRLQNEAEAYLNFKTGLEKYSGLKDIAVSHGIVQQNGSTYSMGDKKLGYYKNWRNDEETWNSILPKLESSINEKYRYGKSLDEGAILEQEDE